MIRSLIPQLFRDFGTILTEKSPNTRYANHHFISLSPHSTTLYQTAAETYLTAESGNTVLSVSSDNVTFLDFYLDKPVRLRSGVWFSLTALQKSATVQLSAFSMPRLLTTRTEKKDFLLTPQLHISTLYTFFYQEKEQGFLFPGETHPMYELVYVDSGTLHSVVDGQDLLLSQGELMLYGKDQWHMQYADIGIAPRFVTLTFDMAGNELEALLNRKHTLSYRTLPVLQQMLRELDDFCSYSPDMILSLLQILLILLLRQPTVHKEVLQTSHAINSENEIVQTALQYIGTHVREKLSVPIVANNTEVSPSYLTALFHKHLQISPGEYIRRIKLQESKQMIREGSMNFTEIADALQYSTVHHFSRQFKEKFGITPTEYAKSVR